jgi:hypothetical protein
MITPSISQKTGFYKYSKAITKMIQYRKRCKIKKVLNLIIALHLLFSTDGFCQVPLKIMPLGNSITFDTYGGDPRDVGDKIGYRYKLYLLLNQAGYNFNLVGSEEAGWNYFNDYENAGFPGWRNNQLADLMETGYFYNYPVDIILLHIGTNDVSASDYSVTDVDRLLDAVDAYEAGAAKPVIVLLAKIISRKDYPCGNHTGTVTFNNNLVTMANTRISEGDNLIVVDMECGAGINYSADMIDFAHPNQTGYDKMGQKWFDVIDAINTAPSITDIPDQNRQEGSAFANINLDNYIFDVEDEDQYITWSISPANPDHFNLNINGSRIATITPKDPDWNGSETITFIATDRGKILTGLKKSASDQVQFTVTPVNDPPVIISQNTPLSTPEETDLEILIDHLNVEDIDNPSTDLSLTVLSGTSYSFNSNTITPATDFNGELSVNVIVSDLEDSSEPFGVTVNVTPVNDTPSINIPEILTADEDKLYYQIITASDGDPDDSITMSAQVLPGWLSFNATSGVLQGTPFNSDVGKDSIVISAFDGTVYVDSSFIIEVININDPPDITSIPVLTAYENELYMYIIEATDVDSNDSLTYSGIKIPEWLTFFNTTKVLAGKPSYDDIGSNEVILAVDDGIDTVKQSFFINVIGTNVIKENQFNLTDIMYPVPATDYIIFKMTKAARNSKLQIYSILGSLIMEIDISYKNLLQIQVAEFEPGIYIYKIISNNGYQTGRLMIK